MNHDEQLRMLYLEHGAWLEKRVRQLQQGTHWYGRCPDDVATRVWTTVTRQIIEGQHTAWSVENWRGYLTTLTQREINKDWRKLRRSGILAQLPEDWSPLDRDNDPLAGLERDERLKAYGHLDEPLPSLLRLLYEDGLPAGDAARKLGLEAGVVRSLVSRLKRKVKQLDDGGEIVGEDADGFRRFRQALRQGDQP